MQIYDAELGPSEAEWLVIDEAERIALVESYHRRRRIRVPRLRLHATIHIVVENQIALGEVMVIDAMARLRAEGLTRHDAVHAIGMVLAGHIYDLLKSPPAERTPTRHISSMCGASLRLSGCDRGRYGRGL